MKALLICLKWSQSGWWQSTCKLLSAYPQAHLLQLCMLYWVDLLMCHSRRSRSLCSEFIPVNNLATKPLRLFYVDLGWVIFPDPNNLESISIADRWRVSEQSAIDALNEYQIILSQKWRLTCCCWQPQSGIAEWLHNVLFFRSLGSRLSEGESE